MYDWTDEAGTFFFKVSKETLQGHATEVLSYMHSLLLESEQLTDSNQDEEEDSDTASENNSDVDVERTDNESDISRLSWSNDAGIESNPARNIGILLTRIYEVNVIFSASIFFLNYPCRSVPLPRFSIY